MDYSIYFVPTPIGNLEDMTIRAINVLKSVDIIACEDTRESKKLLNYFDINKKLTSYHKFNEKQKSQEIIKATQEGRTYAIITDQGMPGISDPGHILIKECIKNNISYTILPGPSSILTGLIASGFDNDRFSFYGVIPKKSSDKKKLYQELKKEDKTSILFDTPHNLENTINDFKKKSKVYLSGTPIVETSVQVAVSASAGQTLEETIEYLENYPVNKLDNLN